MDVKVQSFMNCGMSNLSVPAVTEVTIVLKAPRTTMICGAFNKEQQTQMIHLE